MDRASKSRADSLIEWLRGYADARINSRLIDERRMIPPYVIMDLANRGVFGLLVPETFGGLGLAIGDALRVFEQLAAIDMSLTSVVGIHVVLGTQPILRAGRPELCDELVPLLAQGRELAAFALTEPAAGSNFRAISATAMSDGRGGWRLNGEKTWIGNASWAGILNVFVKTQDVDNESLGMTGFAVRQGTPGLRQGPEVLTMGMRGMVQNRMYLSDVPVDSKNVLGEVGQGLKVAQEAMMLGRLWIGSISLGGMKRCAQLMLRYAERRAVSSGRLLDNPVALKWLNDLTAAITSVEILTKHISERLDQGQDVPEEAYIACKTSGPEFLWQAADRLVQLLGGRGYIETNAAPQLLRDARLLRIFEGPTEALNAYLGARTLIRGKPLYDFLHDDMGAPRISRRLRETVAEINGTLPTDIHGVAHRWAQVLVGEAATFALLAAAMEGVDDPPANLCHALDWADSELEQRLESARSAHVQAERLRGPDPTGDLISTYAGAIGNIEQCMAGEDHETDPMLRRVGA